MIDVNKLSKGDKLYQCYEYHWKVKYEFIQVLKDGRIKVKNTKDIGMFRKGEIEYITEIDLKECFIDDQSAIEYQKKCRQRVAKKSKDELLKGIFNKANGAGIFTDEESKVYRKAIYK